MTTEEIQPDATEGSEPTAPTRAPLPALLWPQRWVRRAALLHLLLWLIPVGFMISQTNGDEILVILFAWTVCWMMVALPAGLVFGLLAARLATASGRPAGAGNWWLVGISTFSAAHWAALLPLVPAYLFSFLVGSHRGDALYGAFFSLFSLTPVVLGLWLAHNRVLAASRAEVDVPTVTSAGWRMGSLTLTLVGLVWSLGLPLFGGATSLVEQHTSVLLLAPLWAAMGLLLALSLARSLRAMHRALSQAGLGDDARPDESYYQALGFGWALVWSPLFVLAAVPTPWAGSAREDQVLLYTACILAIVVGVGIGSAGWKDRLLREAVG